MHTMKTKMIAGAAAALLAAMALTGCGGSKAGSGDTIKIGVNMELTGSQASYGVDGLQGAQMAVEEINANGGVLGKKLELVTADNKSEPSESASAVQKLVDEKVSVIVGAITSSNTLAAVSISNGDGVPSITPGSTNPKVTVDEKTGKTIPYSFRTCFIDPYQGEVMANFAYNKLNARRAAVLIDNSSDYGKGLAKYFQENFVKSGGEIVGTEAYLQKDTDFNAILTNIKTLNPDFIYVPGYYQEVGLIVKQARGMGITAPFAGGDTWDSATLADIAGAENLNNTYYSNLYAVQEDNQKSMDFTKKYKEKYNMNPSVYGVLTYDTIHLIAQVIKDGNSAEPEKIKESLEKLQSFEGIAGALKFNETHDAIRPAFILTYKDGQPVFLDKISAE